MSTRTLFPVILGSGGSGPTGNYAVNLNMSMDSNYVISAQLVDQNGSALGNERTIDLPLESVVVGGSYDSTTKSIILTLDNGQSVTIPVGDLVSGLQTEIDSNNPLNADYLTDGTTNKVYTATEKTKLQSMRPVVEVNNMTQAELLDFYTNYATLMTQNTYVVDGHEAVATTMELQPYGTVLILESNVRYKNEFAGAPAGTIDAAGTATYIFADGSKQRDNLTFNFPETSGLATVATSGSYNDLSNKPTIPTVDVTAAGNNTFTGSNTFTGDTLIGDWSDIALNLSVGTYGMPQIEGSDANTYKGFYINTDGIVFNDSNLGDNTGLGITLDSSTGDVSIYAGFGGIDFQSATVTVNSNPVATTDMLPSGTDDGTNWTTLTIGGVTKNIPSGGGSNEWFGTQEQFDAIPQNELDPDTNYYITDQISWDEIADRPMIPTDTSQLQNGAGFVDQSSLDNQMFEMAQYIKDRDVYLTAAEYAAMEQAGTLEEDKNYHIEGEVSTVTAVVTFTDQTTATYNVYIKPTV